MDDDAILQLRVSESLITCQICMETFESPRILPCQHTFCKECVTSLIQKYCLDSDGQTKRSSFPCPNCRRECKIRQKGNYTVEEHLNKCFPENLLMKTIMDSKFDPVSVSSSCSNGEAVRTERQADRFLENQDREEKKISLTLSVFLSVCLHLTCYKAILNHLINVISHADSRVPSFSPVSFYRVNHNFLAGAVFDMYMVPLQQKIITMGNNFVDELTSISELHYDMFMRQLFVGEPGLLGGCDNFVMKDVGCQTSETLKEPKYFYWILLCVTVIISVIGRWFLDSS